jgi:hypothetical protein
MNVIVPNLSSPEPERANNFGLLWQAERDTAFDRTTRVETSSLPVRSKAPSRCALPAQSKMPVKSPGSGGRGWGEHLAFIANLLEAANVNTQDEHSTRFGGGR